MTVSKGCSEEKFWDKHKLYDYEPISKQMQAAMFLNFQQVSAGTVIRILKSCLVALIRPCAIFTSPRGSWAVFLWLQKKMCFFLELSDILPKLQPELN